jgi:peptidoglycan-associated lipoprotein
MRTKLVSLFAMLFLITACETTPEDSGATDSSGSTDSSSSSSSSSVTTETVDTETVDTTAVDSTMEMAPEPGSQEQLQLEVGDRVFFEYDKSVVAAAAEKTLKRQAAWMKQYPSVSITVEGHCDERGTREYNLALGERRATAVKNFLVALGVSSNRIATISYGKERPDALGHNKAAWAQNRRGVTTVN